MSVVIGEKDKKILYTALLVTAVVIDVVVILGWQFRLLFRSYKNAGETKQSIQMLKQDSGNLDKFKQEGENLDQDIKKLNLSITEERDISALVENISNLAANSGVKILHIKPVADNENLQVVKTKQERFGEIEIQITAKADFHQFGNFLSKVESADKFFKLSSLAVETDSKNYFIQNINLSLRSVVRKNE